MPTGKASAALLAERQIMNLHILCDLLVDGMVAAVDGRTDSLASVISKGMEQVRKGKREVRYLHFFLLIIYNGHVKFFSLKKKISVACCPKDRKLGWL